MKKKSSELNQSIVSGLIAIIIALFVVILFNTHRALYFFIILLIVYAYLKLQLDLIDIMKQLDKLKNQSKIRRKRK